MSVFEEAASVLFADPNLAQDGTYTPSGGGSPVPVRVVVARRPEEIAGLGQVGARRPKWQAALLRAEVAARPQDGDTLVVGGDTYTIRTAEPDEEGTSWSCEIQEA